MTIENKREAFELWWQSRGLHKPSRCTEPNYTDKYDNPMAQIAWEAWLAAKEIKP